MNEQIELELKSLLNSRFSTSESTRANYARGEDTYDPILSEAVVFPETNEEVSKILTLCPIFTLFAIFTDFSIIVFSKVPLTTVQFAPSLTLSFIISFPK